MCPARALLEPPGRWAQTAPLWPSGASQPEATYPKSPQGRARTFYRTALPILHPTCTAMSSPQPHYFWGTRGATSRPTSHVLPLPSRSTEPETTSGCSRCDAAGCACLPSDPAPPTQHPVPRSHAAPRPRAGPSAPRMTRRKCNTTSKPGRLGLRHPHVATTLPKRTGEMQEPCPKLRPSGPGIRTPQLGVVGSKVRPGPDSALTLLRPDLSRAAVDVLPPSCCNSERKCQITRH